jgi:YD repeat-containing protein
LGRVTTLTYSDGKQTRFTYDAASSVCAAGETYGVGRLASATDRDGGNTAFCYDFAGRVVRKSQTVRGVRLDVAYGCKQDEDSIDNFVSGESTGASAFYGIGAGVVLNGTGTAVETGFGTPGASFQVFDVNRKIADTIFSW